MSANENYNNFVNANLTMAEVTKQECERKIMTLQSYTITYAIVWTIVWTILGFILGLVISLIVNISNYSKRSNYKSREISRLQMKMSQLADNEVQQPAQNINPNS